MIGGGKPLPRRKPRQRMSGRSREAWVGWVLALGAAAACAAGSASAQDIPEVISPLRVESDHNGVNLTTGRMAIDMPALSVPAAPNLRFDRLQNAAPYVLGKSSGSGVDGAVVNYSVHTGTGVSESFRCDGGTCTSITGTGSTFGGNIYVQAGSGARWNFHNKHVDTTGTDPNGTAQYYLTSITYPNGEVISYTYQTGTLAGDTFNRIWYRPTRISSNLGYHIAIAYQAGTTVDNGWSNITTAAIYRSGTTPLLLRRFTYSGNTITDWGNSLADVGGRAYVCSGCNYSLGSRAEVWTGSLQLPTETSPTLQVAQTTQTATSSLGTRTNVQLIGSVTRDGVVWSYTYGSLSYEVTRGYWWNSLTVTGPDGYRRVYGFARSEQQNILTSLTENVTATTTRLTQFRYNSAGQPDQITYPESNRVNLAHDAFGNITSRTTTPKPLSGLTAVTETASYRTDCDTTESSRLPCWRPTSSRDALGRQTDYAYNASGQLTERTDPADASNVRRRTIVEYAPSATGVSRREVVRVCGTGAACGSTSEIRTEYDYYSNTMLVTAERRIDTARNVTLTTTYEYDAAGNVLRVDGPLAGTADAVYYRYDPFGRREREVGPLGDNQLRLTQVHTYRNSDNAVTRTQTATVVNPDDTPTGLSRVDYGYDARRNPVREAVVSGTTTYSLLHRTFYQSNRVQCEARRMNPAVFATVTTNACALGTAGTAPNDFGPDRITHNSYDSAGQLTLVQQAYATPLQQNYAAYLYSPNGLRTRVTDANGNRADLRYDGFDRLSRWVFPSRTTVGAVNEADYELYGYDAVGNRTSLRKRDTSTLIYAYDNLNRMRSKTVPERTGLAATHTRDVFYGYNVLDLTTYARFDSTAGEGVTQAYDALGRELSSTLLMDGASRAVSRARDDVNNRINLTYGGQTYRYDFDPAGRLRTLYEGTGTTTVLAAFQYNARGQVDLRTEGVASSVNPGYDAVGRLTSLAHAFATTSGNVTFGLPIYNPAGQIERFTRSNDSYAWSGGVEVDRAYSVNGLNQYTAAGTATFTYDANGNLRTDGSNTYTYDVENRLVAVSGARTANLRYEPLGRLYEIGAATPSRRLLWDGDALVAEYQTTTGTPLAARFVHGTAAGVDDPLVWYGGGENRRLHADHQGSVVAVTNGTGTATWINGYDEWGIPNATGNTGRFQYTGQIWIAELGMYHYKARIYSPTLGRFLQTDPIGYEGGINLYAYVANDPVNHTDPTGQECNAEGTACWSDNYQGNVSGVNVRREADVDATVRANAGSFQRSPRADSLTGRPTEPRATINRSADGSLTVARQNSTGRQTSTGERAAVRVAPNAEAVVHGHLAAANGSRTVVDTPDENRGWGDAQSLGLTNAIPTYTVAGDRIGVHTAPDGHVTFEMIEGTMSGPEMQAIQKNLNRQQSVLDALRGRR